jgi:anti-anti-sigma factor
MEIHREILPESYLLILAEDHSHPEEYGLAKALQQAARSGKPSIWVDCSSLRHMSIRAMSLLTRYYERLRQRNTQLVLCHLTDEVQDTLRATSSEDACPPVVPTLLDAALYCHAAQKPIGPSPTTTTAGWGVALS